MYGETMKYKSVLHQNIYAKRNQGCFPRLKINNENRIYDDDHDDSTEISWRIMKRKKIFKKNLYRISN